MHIQLENFHGPFELLLRLIDKHEIDIYDIPIAKLTRQYMDALRELPRDMEDMSAFLVMAATLLDIKTRMLLPRPPQEDDAEEGEDPRETLVRQLLAYQECQAQAAILRGIEAEGLRIFRGAEQPLFSQLLKPDPLPPEAYLGAVTFEDMQRIFEDVLLRQSSKVDTVRQGFNTVVRDPYPVAVMVSRLRERLNRTQEGLHFRRLFTECATKQECIATFLAVLEMVRHRIARLRGAEGDDLIIEKER